MEVVILGMHRSGTSLLASIVMELGVNMGDDMLGSHPSQPHGHFEDRDFYELNMDILKAAGGNWINPPERNRILAVSSLFRDRIRNLVARKRNANRVWGWKDPRTCLTFPLYAAHLHSPRFLYMERQSHDVIKSLMARGGGNREKWQNLIDLYRHHLSANLLLIRPRYSVFFEQITNREKAEFEVEKIKAFLGLDTPIDRAVKRIEFR